MSQSETLIVALQITAIGMGLVFAAIILLWIVMAVLVRVTADKVEPEQAPETGEQAVEASLQAGAASLIERKRLAAAAAVTVALARQCETSEPHEFPLPPTAVVSAWQTVLRTRMLSKRGPTR
jgi:Na+-transporting methylmalonyl-CoA/oxaloacetate decarboxylase gamma subunit